MSSTLLARARLAQRQTASERAWLFFYYRREMRWGSRRAHHYAALDAWYWPVQTAAACYCG